MIRRLCCAVLAGAFAFALAEAALAQTPPDARLALAREVVSLSGAEETMTQMMETMTPMLMADLAQRGVPADAAGRFAALFIEEFRNDVPRVLELTAIAYAGAFSETELTDLRNFFSTPTGQALRRRAPELTAAMTRAGALIGEEAARRAAERFEAESARAPENP